MATRQKVVPNSIPALEVHQWLSRWDTFSYSANSRRKKPAGYFLLFSMNAAQLRRLAGVNYRNRSNTSFDTGIQRRHEESRSLEIGRYVRNGYPFSVLSEARREEAQNEALRKPGWLPTAVVVNLLTLSDARQNRRVAREDLITVGQSKGGLRQVTLPQKCSMASWRPVDLPPIEIIDGQHRLFAFGAGFDGADFDLPVVAFIGLDISWQAYLFWTINIKPKKINPSLAFDLYPLLRSEEWLEIADQFGVYRETRSQEIVEILWAYPRSRWYQRIDMLGEKRGVVSQASFVRSLLATLVKRWEGKGVAIGGLFGGPLGKSEDPLSWSRVQQAAFVILFWDLMYISIHAYQGKWATALRNSPDEDKILDASFYGRHSLLNQDQGVRVALHILNDLVFVSAERLELDSWIFNEEYESGHDQVLSGAITSLRKTKVAAFVSDIAEQLSHFDWRSANGPNMTEFERRNKLIYRGSGGYRALRLDLLSHLSSSKRLSVRRATAEVLLRMRKEPS